MKALIVAILGIIFLSLSTAVCAEQVIQTNDLVSDIERLSVLGEKAPESLGESIYNRIEQHNTNVSSVLLSKLGEQGTNEQKLVVYLWALGLCKDPQAVPAVIKLADQANTKTLKKSCWRSLANLGGDRAGEYLLASLERLKDRDDRFDLFNLLGEMQYEPALSKSGEVLEGEFYRPIFVYCKMGDKAVPFLVNQLNHTNRIVRGNTISVLGQWMLAPEALQPLKERFWKEQDPEIQTLILSSVTQIANGKVSTEFLNEVAKKAKDQKMAEKAQEGLESFKGYEEHFLSLKKQRKPSPEIFKREYDSLYASDGHKGDYEALAKSSRLADEPTLKKLRERILQRNSDECFSDYRRVTEIIWQNRFFAELK